MEKILLESLRHAREVEIGPICRRLIETDRPRAVTAALHHLERLDDATRRWLIRRPIGIGQSARAILTGNNLRAIGSVIQLIEQRGDVSLAIEVASLLTRERGQFARPAARTLLSLTEAWLRNPKTRPGDASAEAYLDEAIVKALHSHREHRRQEVLLAAALMSRNPGPRLKNLLDDGDDPAHFALRGVVERVDQPIVRRLLLRWLDTPVMGRSAARWLHKVQGVEAWAEVLGSIHLLAVPKRRAALRQADKPARCLPALDEVTHLPRPAQANLAGLVSPLRLPASAKIMYLGSLVSSSEPRGRMRALNALLGYRGDEALAQVRRFCFDPERSIARVAGRHIMKYSDATHDEFLERLVRAGHSSMSDSARWTLARRNVRAFMRHWLDLKPGLRNTVAHQHWVMHRREFLEAITNSLMSDQRTEALAAIELVRRLHLGSRVERQLINRTFHVDPRLASAAVMALGESGTPGCLDALRAALGHDDSRVQANAVESLMKRDAPETADLVSFLTDSRRNRPRANAIVALHRAGRQGSEHCLREMLLDGDPLHRISALWAVRRGRIGSLRPVVQSLALNDRLSPVRRRAGRTLRALSERSAVPTGRGA